MNNKYNSEKVLKKFLINVITIYMTRTKKKVLRRKQLGVKFRKKKEKLSNKYTKHCNQLLFILQEEINLNLNLNLK